MVTPVSTVIAESPSSASSSFILPTIFLDVVVSVVFAREEPTSESSVLTSADKVFNALVIETLSALSLKPPSFPELSAVILSKATPPALISLIAPVSVFAVVVKVVCGLAPISESNSLIAKTKLESREVVNLARPPTSSPIKFTLSLN